MGWPMLISNLIFKYHHPHTQNVLPSLCSHWPPAGALLYPTYPIGPCFPLSHLCTAFPYTHWTLLQSTSSPTPYFNPKPPLIPVSDHRLLKRPHPLACCIWIFGPRPTFTFTVIKVFYVAKLWLSYHSSFILPLIS